MNLTVDWDVDGSAELAPTLAAEELCVDEADRFATSKATILDREGLYNVRNRVITIVIKRVLSFSFFFPPILFDLSL